MLFKINLIFALFGGSAFARCKVNNCVNALGKPSSVGSAFCSTYIETTSTSTVTPTVTISNGNTISPPPTVYPPIPAQVTPDHVSLQCQKYLAQHGAISTPLSSRLSSACSCFSIVPATVTTTIAGPATTTTIANVGGKGACTDLTSPYVTNGRTFDLKCFSQYNTNNFEWSTVQSFQECVDLCGVTLSCVAASFTPFHANSQKCAILYEVGPGQLDYNWNAALLIAG